VDEIQADVNRPNVESVNWLRRNIADSIPKASWAWKPKHSAAEALELGLLANAVMTNKHPGLRVMVASRIYMIKGKPIVQLCIIKAVTGTPAVW
jgi:hypothetical protein